MKSKKTSSVAPKSGKDSTVGIKSYVLDTNVLIHDPQSIFRFEEHNVIIPVEVLEELDHIKGEQSSERGHNAREVNRTLTKLFPNARAMQKGVPLESGGTLLVVIRPLDWDTTDKSRTAKVTLRDAAKKDNLIIQTAIYVGQIMAPPVILVTKDANVQLKARAVGLESQDYLNDKIYPEHDRTEEANRLDVDVYSLQRFASDGELEFDSGDLKMNEYVILATPEGRTMPARATGPKKVVRLRYPIPLKVPNGGIAIHAKNLEQQFLLDALFNPNISLIAVRGKAGTGKTLLSIAAALAQVMGPEPRYNQVLISRAVMALGKDIGFLPGTLTEKLLPWIMPYYDALDFLMPRTPQLEPQFAGKRVSKKPFKGSESPSKPYDALVQSGLLQIEAITYLRGRSIPNSFMIVDESQQLTKLEIKTIITRISEGGKLVIAGDPAQIDNPYLDAYSNGLVHVLSKMQGQEFFAGISLTKGERSRLAEAGATLL